MGRRGEVVTYVGKMEGEQVVQVLEALWLNFLDEVGSPFLRLQEAWPGGAQKGR